MKGREQTVAEPPRSLSGRFDALDAYRGIAALMIVVFHAYQFSREGTAASRYVYEGTMLHVILGNLDAGVSFFFALSGFLVFLPFARAAIEQGSRQSARGYLIRRAIRIAPLYYVAIALAWSLNYGGDRQQWIDLVEHLTFTQVFDNRHIFWDIGPAWSLSDELLFYVFVAVVGSLAFRLCRRLAGRRGRVAALLAVCFGVVGASVAYKAVVFYAMRVPSTNFAAYFGPLARIDSFAFGMVVAVLVAAGRERSRVGPGTALLLRAAGFGAVAFAFATRDVSAADALYFHTICGFGLALLVASSVLSHRHGSWTRVLAARQLQLLGLVSYSLYLWHEPLMLQLAKHGLLVSQSPHAFPANALVLVGLSLAVAYASYWLIEYPALQLRHLFTRDGSWSDYYSAEQQTPALSAAST